MRLTGAPDFTNVVNQTTSTSVEFLAHVVILPSILCVGLAGQLVNLITLHKSILNSATLVYLKAIAYAQFISILVRFPSIVYHAYNGRGGQWPCSAVFYNAHIEIPLMSSFGIANAFSIIGLALERFLTQRYPGWAQKLMGTCNKARFQICVIYALAFLLNTPIIFQKYVNYSITNETLITASSTGHETREMSLIRCGYAEAASVHDSQWRRSFKIFLLCRDIISCLIPITTIVILSFPLFLTRKRKRTNRPRRLLSMKRFSPRRTSSRRRGPGLVKGQEKRSDHLETVQEGEETHKQPSQQGANTLALRYRRTKRDNKGDHDRRRLYSVLLVVTVSTFILCTIPACVHSMVAYGSGQRSLPLQAFQAAAYTLEAMGYSVNFYLYCACSPEYRKLLFKWMQRCV